jgi:hypothetical protein
MRTRIHTLPQQSGSKIHTWDLRKIAASTMNEDQRNNFGRYDTLTGNATGAYGHQMVGDRYGKASCSL